MRDKDHAKPFTLRRALRAPEFWLLVAASLAAAGGVRWWIMVPLTLAGLSLSSLPKYMELRPLARDIGAHSTWWSTVALSLFNSLAASCAAYLLGVLIRWFWW